MSWITTVDGHELDLRMPLPGLVSVYDIAWSMAQTNRFLGRCIRPYSNAEHSLLVCEIAERELGLDVHGQMAALMHDAHEAYTQDLHPEAKRQIGDAWFHFERRFAILVSSVFGLHAAFGIHAAAIKRADNLATACERRDLLPPTPTPWPELHNHEPLGWVQLNTPERRQHDWEFWRDRFLDRFHELEFARQLQREGCSRHDPQPQEA